MDLQNRCKYFTHEQHNNNIIMSVRLSFIRGTPRAYMRSRVWIPLDPVRRISYSGREKIHSVSYCNKSRHEKREYSPPSHLPCTRVVKTGDAVDVRNGRWRIHPLPNL